MITKFLKTERQNRLFIIAKFNDEDYEYIASGLGKQLKKGLKPSAIIANHLDVDLILNY